MAANTPIEYCPVCRRIMVGLSEFCESGNVAGIDRATDFSPALGGIGRLLSLLFLPISLIGVSWKQRRLDRVLAEYPYSLYCAGCGRLERRRFAPEDETAAGP